MKKNILSQLCEVWQEGKYHNNKYYYIYNLIKTHSRTPCVNVYTIQVDIDHHIAKPRTIWKLWRSRKVMMQIFNSESQSKVS